MKIKIRYLVRIFIILFGVLILFNVNSKAATENVNGLEWSYTVENGKAVGVYVSNGIIPSVLTVPDTLGGYEVTRLGMPQIDTTNRNILTASGYDTSYYSANNNVTKIILPDSLKEIDDYSFCGLKKLTTVVSASSETSLPNITRIGKRAFYNCNLLNSLGFQDGLTTIDEYAFYYCSGLTTLSLPNTVSEVGQYAFQNCTNLTEINIPTSLTIIPNSMFYYCSKLTNITIPENVVEIGNNAFAYCSMLNNVVIPNTVTTIGNGIFVNCINLDTISLPSNLTELPNGIFQGCTKINVSDYLVEGITKIGNSAFSNCTQITSITIPSSVTQIGNSAFSGCRNMTEVIFNGNEVNFGTYVFQNCSSLTTINLQTSLTEIPTGMFSGCTSLNILGVLTENITKISDRAFQQCSQLTSLTLPNNITEIGDYAFSNCSNLSEVTVPASVTKVGNYAFYYDQYLTTIVFQGDNVEFGNYVFQNDTRLYSVTLPTNVYELTQGMFYGCNGIDIQAIFNSNPTKIGNQAFAGGSSKYYTTLTIPDSVVEIGIDIFGDYKTIDVLNIGSGIEKIGRASLFKVQDTFINRNYGTVEIAEGNDNGGIHYIDTKPRLSLSLLPGVKVINTDTNEEVAESEFEIGSTLNYQIVVEDGYSYDNLYYTFNRQPDKKYNGDRYSTNMNLNSDVEYTYAYSDTGSNTDSYYNIQRDFSITVQQINQASDYVVRTFITKINGANPETSREPVFEIEDGIRKYKSTKLPVNVETGDIIRYTIRVYNEGKSSGRIQEIKAFIPDNMELIKESGINAKNKWNMLDDNIAVTTMNQVVRYYYGSLSDISYYDIGLELRVKSNRTEENKYVPVIAELSSADAMDCDSTGNEITVDMLENYKKQESLLSDSNSYIVGETDNTDFDAIIIPTTDDITTDYRLVIEKVDSLTGEMLNGARFNLTDEEGNILQTGVTAQDGTLDFGMMTSVGNGTDTYFVEEIERPEGYSNPITYRIKVTVEKNIYDYINGLYTLDVYCDLEDIDINLGRYDIIPIYTKDQFKKIGSHEVVEIDGDNYTFDNTKRYMLMNDIDLAGENWTPIDTESAMIDGNNHSIKNLTISTDLSDIKRPGLFGTFSGYVVDLNLEDVNIQAIKSDDYKQPADDTIAVGALAGYMSQGIIRNCKVSGEISTNVNNVGGFIGHSERGGIIVFNQCENNAAIEISYANNAGGFIGVALGTIEIRDSVNNGDIIALRGSTSVSLPNKAGDGRNAGGFVGVAEPKEYETNAVKASYDKNTKIITLTVKNESIIGKYKVRLENRDVQTLNLIEGSVFDILDENKQILNEYSGVVLTNGKLNVADIDINCVGTDIYYIKQISTPDGYEVISDEFIKVTITKTWNSLKDIYEISVETETINDEQYQHEEPTEDVSTSRTGIIHRIMDYTNVIWTNNKVLLKNCVNNGLIESADNVGGFIALGNTTFEAYNCENKGIVRIGETSFTVHAGGIAGFITKPDEMAYVKIINCTNSEEIQEKVISGSLSVNNVAGIIAYSFPDILIDGCKNNGLITSNSATISGIIGTASGNVKVYNSDNNVDLVKVNNGTPSDACAGGIVGKTLATPTISSKIGEVNGGNGFVYGNGYVSDSYRDIEIKNCSNKGSIYNSGHVGGIIGLAYGQTVTISDCEVIGTEDNPIEFLQTSGDTAGIIGFTDAREINVENCDAEYLTISIRYIGTYGSVGAIIGNAFSQYAETDTFNVSINNCIAKHVNFTSQRELGGIAGQIQVNKDSRVNSNFSIKNCLVEDMDILNNCNTPSTTYAGVGGIVSHIKSINDGYIVLENNTVKDSRIINKNEGLILTSSSGDINAGGIVAKIGTFNNLIVNNCDIENVRVENGWTWRGGSQTTVDTAGIIAGDVTGGNNNRIVLSNCDVNNSELYSTMGDNAGIANIYMTYKNIEVSNCNINNTQITNTADNDCSHTSGIVSLMGGNIAEVLNIHDCTVNDSSIFGAGDVTGGIVGSMWAIDGKLTNCSVNNTDITRSGVNTDTSTSLGGVLGFASSTDIEISNCDFIDSTINSNTRVTGGIYGAHLRGNLVVNNCNVLKGNINGATNSMLDITGYCVAGIVGETMSSTNDSEITNCSVKESTITSKSGHIGGIVACVGLGNNNVSNNTIENVDLHYYKDFDEYNYIPNKCVGGIAAVISGGNSEEKISDSTIKNLNIVVDNNQDIQYSDVGGIVGLVDYNSAEIKNIDVTGLNIVNNSPSGNTGGAVGYADKVYIEDVSIVNSENDEGIYGLYHTGGLVGLGDVVTIEDSTVENIKVNSDNYAGGVIGADVKSTNSRQSMSQYYVYIPLTEETKLELNNITAKNINVTGGSIAGGILAGSDNYANINLDTVNVSDVDVTSTENMAGGVIGNASSFTAKDITVEPKKSEATGEYIEGSIGANVKSSSHAGGIVANISGTAEIENVKVNKVTATTTNNGGTNIGGIVGGTNGITLLGDVELDNVSVNGGANAGGIAGIGHSYRMPEGATVKNISVNAPNSSLAGGLFANGNGLSATHINVDGMTVIGNQNVGGVIATTSSGGTISDITIANANISSENERGLVGGLAGTIGVPLTEFGEVTISNSNIESAFHAGGLFGTVSTPTYINGAIVEGTKVESTGENGISGGIVAVASNSSSECEVSIENSEVRGIAADTEAGTEAKESEVKALNHAGGMIGFTTIARIKDSKVNNTKVTSTNGISGAFAGVVSLTTSEINAQADAAENGTTYTGRTVSKLMLSGSTIADVILAGLNYVNDYLGCGIIE